MHEHEAVRRLVKSPPELWAQCSDPNHLARHLCGFGEIRIIGLDPESTVAWEGESARGTVSLEASGWGTRVRLTAGPPALTTAPVGGSTPAPDSVSPRARGLSGLLGALWRLRRGTPGPAAVATAAPAAVSAPTADPAASPAEVIAGLEAALDSLGRAHHRPYSRT